MKKKKVIISILLLIVITLFAILSKKRTVKEIPPQNNKPFIVDQSRHLDKKMFISLVGQKNTQILNLSNTKSAIFSENEIKLSGPIPTDEEINQLEKTRIYLVYCEEACSDSLFEIFYKKGLALYDLKENI